MNQGFTVPVNLEAHQRAGTPETNTGAALCAPQSLAAGTGGVMGAGHDRG